MLRSTRGPTILFNNSSSRIGTSGPPGRATFTVAPEEMPNIRAAARMSAI